MSTYSVFLIFPSILGFIVQGLVFMTQEEYSHPSAAVFAAYIAFWALSFPQYVIDVEDIMAMRWGTTNFADDGRLQRFFFMFVLFV